VIELPGENVRRWTASRKAAVVNAVNVGEVTREEICRRYQISLDEFLSWQRDYESHGLPGLRSTRLQIYYRHRLTVRRRDGRPLGTDAGDGS
jgi:transposase-like protein